MCNSFAIYTSAEAFQQGCSVSVLAIQLVKHFHPWFHLAGVKKFPRLRYRKWQWTILSFSADLCSPMIASHPNWRPPCRETDELEWVSDAGAWNQHKMGLSMKQHRLESSCSGNTSSMGLNMDRIVSSTTLSFSFIWKYNEKMGFRWTSIKWRGPHIIHENITASLHRLP